MSKLLKVRLYPIVYYWAEDGDETDTFSSYLGIPQDNYTNEELNYFWSQHSWIDDAVFFWLPHDANIRDYKPGDKIVDSATLVSIDYDPEYHQESFKEK